MSPNRRPDDNRRERLSHQVRHRRMARGDLSGATDCVEDMAQAAEFIGDPILAAQLREAAFRLTRWTVPS